jgi:ABC-type transporter Mla subunit MlaD
MTITSGASGTGNGTVNFSVAANSGALRTGTLTIAGRTLTVTQATACTYSINPTSKTFDQHGGNVDVHVTTTQGCSWTATTSATWITITSGASGSGNGTTRVTVDSVSSSQLPRTDTVTIAGITFTVLQR